MYVKHTLDDRQQQQNESRREKPKTNTKLNQQINWANRLLEGEKRRQKQNSISFDSKLIYR